MMSIARCKNCKKELRTGLKKTTWYSIEVVTIDYPCKECNRSDETKRTYSFCCLDCLKKFVENMKQEN